MLNPYYIIQNHKNVDEGSKPGMIRELHLPVYSSDELMRTTKDDKMTEEQLAAFNHQLMCMSEAARHYTSAESTRAPKERLVYDRFARVPRGFEYAHVSGGEQHVGTKYAAQRSLLDDTIARMFGLSVAMLKPEGNQRGFLDAFRDNFRNRLCEDAVQLGSYISYIFNQIYAADAMLLVEALDRRKPVIDTSHFTDLPAGHGRMQTDKIDVECNVGLAPPDAPNDLFLESVPARPQELPETRKEKAAAIVELKRKNADFKRAMTEAMTEQGPADAHGGSTRFNRPAKGMFIVTIPVDIHADAKIVKHAFDMGAYTLEEYQQYLRYKMGIGRIPLKEDPAFMNEVVEMVMRTTGSEPPRADTIKPESEDLGAHGTTYKRSLTPSVGVLAAAVKRRRISASTAKEVASQAAPKPKSQDQSKAPKKPAKRKAAAQPKKE